MKNFLKFGRVNKKLIVMFIEKRKIIKKSQINNSNKNIALSLSIIRQCYFLVTKVKKMNAYKLNI